MSAQEMIESELRRAFVAAGVRAYPQHVRLYARNVGVFKLDGGRFFRAGIRGQADLTGYFRLDGITRPIEIEIKRGYNKPDEHQEQWRKHCEAWEITYMLFTQGHKESDSDTVARFVQELGEKIGHDQKQI